MVLAVVGALVGAQVLVVDVDADIAIHVVVAIVALVLLVDVLVDSTMQSPFLPLRVLLFCKVVTLYPVVGFPLWHCRNPEEKCRCLAALLDLELPRSPGRKNEYMQCN